MPALKSLSKLGVSLFEIDVDELVKNIDPELLKDVNFQNTIQRLLKLKPIFDKLDNQNLTRQKADIVNQELSKILENEKSINTPGFGSNLKKFFKNSGLFSQRIIKQIFTPNQVNKKGISGNNLSEKAKENLLAKNEIFMESYRSPEERSIRYEQSNLGIPKTIEKSNYTKYLTMKERYKRIKQIMEDEGVSLNTATSQMLEELGLNPIGNSAYYRDYSKTRFIRGKPVTTGSTWNVHKDRMKKEDPELFKFFDKKVDDYTKAYTKRLEDRPELKKIDALIYTDTNPSLSKKAKALLQRGFFKDLLQMEHRMNKPSLREFYEFAGQDPYKQSRLNIYKKSSYLTTRERNLNKVKLGNKIEKVLLNKENLQGKFDSGDIELSQFVTDMAQQNARLNMLNSELADQGLNFVYFNPKTNEEMFFGKEYSNLGQLLTSEKKGIVPQPADTVGPPKKLKTADEVGKLKQGGLLNIEEMLNSD